MERRLTAKERQTLESIFKLPQSSVLKMMDSFLVKRYGEENVIRHKAFIIARGDIPVGLVAHADTVHSNAPIEILYDPDLNVMWSPQGLGADDRAGIYSIIQIIQAGYRPHIIITTDEEYGCLGAIKCVGVYPEFPGDLKFLIELDRRGTEDSVFYDCENPDFEEYVNKFGFITNWGTMSDITVLSPAWGIASVNFSIGYQEEHSNLERLYLSPMFKTIYKVMNILEDVRTDEEVPKFIYMENPYMASWYGSGRDHYKYAYSDWWDTPAEPAGQGQKCCCFCGDKVPNEDAYLVYWEGGGSFYLCNECFAESNQWLRYCPDCGKAYYVTSKKPSRHNDKWKCTNCEEAEKGEVTVYVGTGKKSNSVQSGNPESKSL